MFSRLRTLFSPGSDEQAEPLTPVVRAPRGQRVYAIGDIHGRLDLFDRLLARIAQDDASRAPADTTTILLGDLIDRGPDSRAVVDRAMTLVQTGKVRVLGGNHEEMLMTSLQSEEAMRHFLRHGGKETLFSYGLDPAEYSKSTLPDLLERASELVPAEHIAFFNAMEDRIVIGDYLFVHAGVRPGVRVEQQTQSDLRWIRQEFLRHDQWHGHMVVHGHTITEEPDVRPNRIGIDTGAFASGRLTALGIEGGDRWFISVQIAPEQSATS